MKALCMIRGRHDWDGGGRNTDLPWRCATCGILDSEAEGHFRLRMRLRKILPVWLELQRWSVALRVGWLTVAYIRFSLIARKPYADYGPCVELDLHAWRFNISAWLGGFWHVDEDGERRSLFGITSTVTTYGIADHICSLFGHKPGEPLRTGSVFCERCHQAIPQSEEAGRAIA